MSSARDELWIWSNLVEAVRALDAVTDSLPPQEDERAWRLFGELDQLRADVERRVFTELVCQTQSSRLLSFEESRPRMRFTGCVRKPVACLPFMPRSRPPRVHG
jgi:hypothetical protein